MLIVNWLCIAWLMMMRFMGWYTKKLEACKQCQLALVITSVFMIAVITVLLL